MTKYYELIKHQGADMPAYFYVDGKRVSRERYEFLETLARMSGAESTFHTKARPIDGGKTRRTNYKTIRID